MTYESEQWKRELQQELISNEEIKLIIRGLGKIREGKPWTDRDVASICQEIAKMKMDAVILEMILSGDLLVDWRDEQLYIQKDPERLP